MRAVNEFSPAWFLRGAHAQTIWGRLTRRRRLVKLRREVLQTPDGDELVLDHLDASAPMLHFVLLHGLEGSSQSVYMQGILDVIRRHGQSATAINFRSCARHPGKLFVTIPNRRPRFYHSGETSDFDFVVRRLPQRPLVAFGASLGGNALLKWLGENPDQDVVTAAATISTPFDLAAGAAYMDNRIGRLYMDQFVSSLGKKIERVIREFPETAKVVDVKRALKARTFREFDNAATAPLHGFRDADDYYARASSIFYLDRIKTPVLCISAKDDPFLPPEVLERVRQVASPSIQLKVTQNGGHVGFISGSAPWKCVYWAEEMVVQWLMDKAAAANIGA